MSELFTSQWLREHERKRASKDNRISVQAPVAVVERNPVDEPLGTAPIQKTNANRILVNVTSRRWMLLDEDNLCEKFVVDCCRYAGLIPTDAPEKTHITVSQIRVPRSEPELTFIRIEYIEP